MNEELKQYLRQSDNGCTCTQEDLAGTLTPEATMNTVAAVGTLPNCAVLVLARESDVGALSEATQLYAAASHYGHSARFLLLRGEQAGAEELAERCRQLVLDWYKEETGHGTGE